MPATYHCDTCGAEATSLDGWQLVSVQFMFVVPNAPPPGGRTLASTAPDLIFDKAECRDAWCEKAGVDAPAAPATA